MSEVRFESSWKKEREREALREARERVLDKAKDRAEREAARRDREQEWMLPGLSQDLNDDGDDVGRAKKGKKSKKEKKAKKEKKKKHKKEKKKKKKRSSSTSSSSSEDGDQWVEKKAEVEKEVVDKSATPKRDGWMEAGGGMDGLFGIRATTKKDGEEGGGERGETEKQRLRREQEERNKEKSDRLELNPNLRKESGVDSAHVEAASAPTGVGDGGASWLRKAYKRAEERAAAEGRSVEEVAAERWGSMENFKRLLARAEGKTGADRRTDSRSSDSRSRQERLREFKRAGNDDRRRDRRSRSRDRRRSRSRSRSRDRRRSRSRDRKRRSRSRDRRRSGDRRRRRSSSSSSSRSRDRDRKRRRDEMEDGRRDGKKFSRPDSDDEDKGKGSSLSSKFVAGAALSSFDHRGGRSSWKTAERRDREKEEDAARREKRKESSSESEDEASCKGKEEPHTEPARPPPPQQQQEEQTVLSEKELNALGAKLVKAELMGNEALVKKLKDKMEGARAARARKEAATGSAEPERETETVVLTRTDARGMTRPVDAAAAGSSGRGPAGGRRRKGAKVETHSKGGERERYFADDDRHSLREMFEREKLSTAEDQNAMLSRLAGRGMETTNEEYDMDDVFAARAARKGLTEEAEKERDRARAIAEHRAAARVLEDCRACFGGARMEKHLLIAVGRTCYLSLPSHASLTEGHCLVTPMSHVSASTLLDEDVWREMQEFRRALVRMFARGGDDGEEEDCVFFESCLNVRGGARGPHLRLECVPVPRESGDVAPMYFQKAIQECEGMWAQNQKLIKLGEKDIRRSVPRELPYFHVDFGMQDGFAHVVEDEKDFPRNFAQEILGGMLDLEPRLWRNPKRDTFEAQKAKVLAFGARWKDVDFTKRKRDSSSSSSSSGDSD